MEIEIIGGTPAFQEAVKNKMVSKGIRADIIKTEAAHTPGPWKKTGLSGEEFNTLRKNRLDAARAAIAKATA